MNAILKSFLIVCGTPTLVAAIYYGLFASDVYVSESRFAIRSSGSGASATGLAAILSSPIVSSGSQDSLVVTDYVKSHDMLNKVQSELDVRAHYSDKKHDLLSRLEQEASSEDLLEYFDRRIELIRDSSSDVITLKVHAYSPEFAQSLAKVIIEQSEDLVNRMSIRMEQDALSVARNEVERLAGKLKHASDQLTLFRNENQSLNPAAESSTMVELVANIEGQLLETRTELSEKLAFMREGSSEIVSLRNRIKVLSRQLSLEKGRISGKTGGTELSGLIDSYQPLVLDQEIAQQQYTSALTSMELARLEAQRKKQYLVPFILPSLPDDALEPRRFMSVVTVFIAALIIYLIGGLFWSALRDHMRS